MPRIHDVETAHRLALNLDAQRTVRLSLAEMDVQGGVLYARQLRALGALAALAKDRPSHTVMEVAGTFKVGQAKAATMLEHGRRSELLSRALELLEAGALHKGTVELLLWTTSKCSDDVLFEVGLRVVDQLVGCDAADARALITAVVLEVEADLDPEAQQRRHAQARANRGVWVKPVEDGMARIGAEVDAATAQGFALGLDQLCRMHATVDGVTGTERTAEQRRADVLAGLPEQHLALIAAVREGRAGELLGESETSPLPLQIPTQRDGTEDLSDVLLLSRLCRMPERRAPRLMVHVPMSTLLDLDNRSGWVEGLGPISAHQARLLRPVAELQAVWVDADTGVPLGIDPQVVPPVGEPDWDDPSQVTLAAETVRQRLRELIRPTAIDDRVEAGRFASSSLARLVTIRDLRCTGPGCPLPASRCELDHLVAVADGGQTAVWSLGLKSPRCHHARHHGWVSLRLQSGETTWISPLGGQYVRRSPWRPPSRIRAPLPPASLDRPDGGLARNFGSSPDVAEPTDEQALPGHREESRHESWLDACREHLADHSEQEAHEPPRWDRPWPSGEPPPF